MRLTGKYRIIEKKEGTYNFKYQVRVGTLTWWVNYLECQDHCGLSRLCPASHSRKFKSQEDTKQFAKEFIRKRLFKTRVIEFDINYKE